MENVTDNKPAFIVKGELFKLLKYLRILGFDCIDAGEMSVGNAYLLAISENRTLLHDKLIPGMGKLSSMMISKEDLGGQLKQVLDRYPEINHSDLFSRCLSCNSILSPTDNLHNLVPESVRERNLEVKNCPDCLRLYWDGSHKERMMNNLADMGVINADKN